MSAAARVGDPIEHTAALEGLLVGLAVGAAAVVGAAVLGVSVIATGGLAAVAIVGATITLTAGIGELIGSLSCCTNQAGQILKGSGNVYINGRPAARAHLDTADCEKHGPLPKVIAEGSDSVYINGQPAARVGDHTVCGGKISAGSNNVNIGGGTKTTDQIDPEVPLWLHLAIGGIGLGSAAVLTTPAIAIAGLFGGIFGGMAGSNLGERWFGKDSNGQKLMAFGGAFLGGGLAGKGRQWFDERYEFKIQGLGSNLGNLKILPKEPKAAFGKATSENYKATFFNEYPHLRGKVVVHHAVEQQTLKRYPDVVKKEELHSLENLRGIPKEKNSRLHLSFIRKEWNQFYKKFPSPTRQQLLDKATEIDNMIGTEFDPPVR